MLVLIDHFQNAGPCVLQILVRGVVESADVLVFLQQLVPGHQVQSLLVETQKLAQLLVLSLGRVLIVGEALGDEVLELDFDRGVRHGHVIRVLQKLHRL